MKNKVIIFIIIDKHKLKNIQNTETAFEFSFFTN